MTRISLVGLVALASLGLSACTSQPARVMLNLRGVQRTLATALSHDDVRVKLAGADLTIAIVNSPLRSLPRPRRRLKARELARLAYDSYGDKARVERIAIIFMQQRTYLWTLSVNDATDRYVFDIGELIATGREASSDGTLGSLDLDL